MSDHWSHEEVEATVSDYFDMLAMELRGEVFNKAEHNRNLQKLLASRTKAAFSFTQQPKLFVLPGSLRNTCSLDPIQFSALPR